MKCIRSHKTGEIVRDTDEDAAKAVQSGAFVYVPKSAFKAQEKAKKEAK